MTPQPASLSPADRAALARVAGFLHARDIAAYLIGGALRDLLLGRPPADLDLAVAAPAASLAPELARLLDATLVTLDADRQVYRLVRSTGLPIDLTTLAGDLPADSRQRDFTVNALYLPLARVAAFAPTDVLDPTGGLADLSTRTLRVVAPHAFPADPLRLFRAIRFVADLGFTLDPDTAASMRGQAGLLATVSAERQRDEFWRILAAPRAETNLRLLDSFGLLSALLPELEQARGVGQPPEHHWTVLEHSLEASGAVERVLRERPLDDQTRLLPWDPELAAYFAQDLVPGRGRATLLKLAALLHDVAKPATKTTEPNGRIHFYGHPTLGAAMTGSIFERLRFSNREKLLVEVMVREHLRPGLLTRGDDVPSPRALYRYFRDAGEAAVDTLFLSFADYLAAKGPLLAEDDWQRYSRKISDMLYDWRAQHARVAAPKLIDGHVLMESLGLTPGPLVGELMEAIREAHAAGELADRGAALALARKLIAERSR